MNFSFTFGVCLPWTFWLLYRGGLLIQWNHAVYNGHPLDTTSWLFYRGGLLILYIVVTLETQPVGCYTEVVCLYSGTCICGHP